MKRLLLLPLLLASLTFSGCAGTKVGDLIAVATTTITNPVNSTNIYQVKNVYAASLALVAEYRRYCWARSYKSLMADPVAKPVCQQRRQLVLAAQRAELKADAAIQVAESFVRNHPTLNAAAAISSAWEAVTAFQNLVPHK